MNVRNSTIGALAAVVGFIATAVVATAPASASIVDTQTKSVTLRYDSRDLNTGKGAERLLSRVSGAASKVCDDNGMMLERFYGRAYRTCRNNAIAQAVSDINRPTVTAAYDRHFAEHGQRALRAALEQRSVGAIQMVAVD